MDQLVVRREAVRDTLYGEVIEDPYRWMEDWQGDELREWVEAQAAYTRAFLDTLPDREPLRQRIAELSDVVPVLTQLAVSAGRYFYLLRAPGESVARLVMRLGLAAPEQVIFDPSNVGGEIHSVIDWYVPSRDGHLVAFGLSQGGSEESVLQVIETDTRRILSDTITRTDFGTVQWLEDTQSFLYHRLTPLPAGAPETDLLRDSRTYLHRVGEDPDNDLPVFGNGINRDIALDPFDFPVIALSDRSEWMVGIAFHGTLPELTIYVAPRAALGQPATIPWKKVVDLEDEVVTTPDSFDPIALDGDTLYLRTYRDAPRYQVVALDLANPDRSTARTVIPPSEIVVESLNLDGRNPTVLYAYGSYGLSIYPSFRPTLLAWYERGGVFAVAHIRGGGENGREWREAGHKLNKGNTIDDFLAAADYLIREGYTSPRYLAG